MTKQTKPTGIEQLKKKYINEWRTRVTEDWELELHDLLDDFTREILDWHNDLILQEKRELLERIEAMTGILKIELAPLKHEFDVNYEIYHSTDGGVIKRNQSREVLLEYENGSKGKRMFSLNERIRVLEDLSTDLKKELEEE